MKTTKPKEPTLRQLVEQEEGFVVESLQMGGYFPQCRLEAAEEADWLHVLQEAQTGVVEQIRFDISDPKVQIALRRALARLIACAEAWDHQLITP